MQRRLVLVLSALFTAVPLAPGSGRAQALGPGAAAGGDELLTISRLRYGGGGDWYVSPSSLPNLLDAIEERTGISMPEREAVVAPLDPTLSDHQFLYVTGHGSMSLTPAEREALRQHLLSGGFLLANDSFGLAESLRREMAGQSCLETPAEFLDHGWYRWDDLGGRRALPHDPIASAVLERNKPTSGK